MAENKIEQVAPKRKPNPKRLEKTLFVNHKEDQALERRLESISLTSRLRMMELDRERINLKNEYRLSKRRNVPHNKPRSRSTSPQNILREPRQTSLDPVNSYLLNEYRRVGEVIPSILMSLSAKEEKKAEFVPRSVPDPEVTSSKSTEEPDMAKILQLIRNVKKIRRDMALSKRLDSNRTKVNFGDLMKNIEAKEKTSSPSDTYTDGACVLLRRKMNRMRRERNPTRDRSQGQKSQSGDSQSNEPSHNYLHTKRHSIGPSKLSDGPVQLPGLNMTRSMTMLGTLGRQKTDMTSYMKSQLAEEDELITRTKVSRELENFDRIRGRIGSFMDRFEERRLPHLDQEDSEMAA